MFARFVLFGLWSVINGVSGELRIKKFFIVRMDTKTDMTAAKKLMKMQIKIKPINQWIGTETKYPARSQFRQTYSSTKKILEFELEKLGALESSLQIEMFIRAEDLRRDGELRANAKPDKPGVVLSFSKVKRRFFDEQTKSWKNELQTLSYPCDSFDDWQDNLRAVALSLEALRKVARYGVFKYEDMLNRLALPSADGKLSSKDSAAEFLAEHSGHSFENIRYAGFAFAAYKMCLLKMHPDKGGDVELFHKLQEAKRILEI